MSLNILVNSAMPGMPGMPPAIDPAIDIESIAARPMPVAASVAVRVMLVAALGAGQRVSAQTADADGGLAYRHARVGSRLGRGRCSVRHLRAVSFVRHGHLLFWARPRQRWLPPNDVGGGCNGSKRLLAEETRPASGWKGLGQVV